MPHRVTLWNKGDMKYVCQQQRGSTAWGTDISGDLLWATYCMDVGLLLINLMALKTLIAPGISQEFRFKKRNLPPLKEMKFPRFKKSISIYRDDIDIYIVHLVTMIKRHLI